tara:strand:+ start:1171 stop:1458 length:288 start_codon:yes stop_codon:yes gene_type:complete
MTRIRFIEIERTRYEIILPEDGEKPIGHVYKKKNSWFIRPYFVTFYKDDRVAAKGYDDFAKAGRALVEIYEYTAVLSRDDNIDESEYIVDLFKYP